MTNTRQFFLALTLASATALPISAVTFNSATAATAEDLNKDASQALRRFTGPIPSRSKFPRSARAVLVFPKIIKAGLVFGGSYGEGVLKEGPKVVNYYNQFRAPGAFRPGHSPTAMSCS